MAKFQISLNRKYILELYTYISSAKILLENEPKLKIGVDPIVYMLEEAEKLVDYISLSYQAIRKLPQQEAYKLTDSFIEHFKSNTIPRPEIQAIVPEDQITINIDDIDTIGQHIVSVSDMLIKQGLDHTQAALIELTYNIEPIFNKLSLCIKPTETSAKKRLKEHVELGGPILAMPKKIEISQLTTMSGTGKISERLKERDVMGIALPPKITEEELAKKVEQERKLMMQK
jgi:hypothetical protein